MILTCTGCGKENQVDVKTRVGDKPVLVWWDSVDQRCKNCRVSDIASGTKPDRDWLPVLVREFDATVLAERVQSGP